MQSIVPLVGLKDAYQLAIKSFENEGGKISPGALVRLSLVFYQDIQVKGISKDPPDNDMLLFQYGTYDWQDDDGEHFSLDIMRQVTEPTLDGEMFQLSWKLIYDPESFKDVTSASTWSINFEDLQEWEAFVISTSWFNRASILQPRMAKLAFWRV